MMRFFRYISFCSEWQQVRSSRTMGRGGLAAMAAKPPLPIIKVSNILSFRCVSRNLMKLTGQ